MTTRDNKEKSRTARETLGKYFYDLSKLVFSIMVLGNLAAMLGFSEDGFNYKSVLAVCLGILTTWAFAFLGNRILKK